MSDSVRPHRRQPTRLPHPWDSPGKNSGVGCHFLLQCMKLKSESEVTQSCPTQRPHRLQPTRLLRPWDFQARVLEWVAIAFSMSGNGSTLIHSHQFLIVPYERAGIGDNSRQNEATEGQEWFSTLEGGQAFSFSVTKRKQYSDLHSHARTCFTGFAPSVLLSLSPHKGLLSWLHLSLCP